MPKSLSIFITIFLVLLIAFWPSESGATRARRDLGTCRYYSSLSTELRCRADGYLMRTAVPYCRDFDRLATRLGRDGFEVLANIKLCLQRSLERMPRLECGNVLAVALRSHRSCYREARFCRLRFFDQLEVLRIAAPVLADPAYARVGNEILGDCFDPSESPDVEV